MRVGGGAASKKVYKGIILQDNYKRKHWDLMFNLNDKYTVVDGGGWIGLGALKSLNMER